MSELMSFCLPHKKCKDSFPHIPPRYRAFSWVKRIIGQVCKNAKQRYFMALSPVLIAMIEKHLENNIRSKENIISCAELLWDELLQWAWSVVYNSSGDRSWMSGATKIKTKLEKKCISWPHWFTQSFFRAIQQFPFPTYIGKGTGTTLPLPVSSYLLAPHACYAFVGKIPSALSCQRNVVASTRQM